MMGAGGLAIEESLNEKSGPKLESKADVALEWSDVTIKFRVITQDQRNAEEWRRIRKMQQSILRNLRRK